MMALMCLWFVELENRGKAARSSRITGRALPCHGHDKRTYVHGRRSGEAGLTRIDHCCYQCLSLIIHDC